LRKRFAYEETLPKAGYAQAVKEMNALVKQLAMEIEKNLS